MPKAKSKFKVEHQPYLADFAEFNVDDQTWLAGLKANVVNGYDQTFPANTVSGLLALVEDLAAKVPDKKIKRDLAGYAKYVEFEIGDKVMVNLPGGPRQVKVVGREQNEGLYLGVLKGTKPKTEINTEGDLVKVYETISFGPWQVIEVKE